MGCAGPAPGWKGTGWGDTAGSSGVLLTAGILVGFKAIFFPRQGRGGDRRWVALAGGRVAWDRDPCKGGKDGTYWLVMEAWVAGWGKLVVQTV